MPERSDIHLLCADISGAVERILLYAPEIRCREFILGIELSSDICQENCEFIEQTLAQNEYWQGSAGIYPAIETSLLELRDILGFVFPNPGELIDYLIQNPGLYDVVMHACLMTAEEFGSTPEISLDIFHDPETGDRYPTIYVRQREYEDDIITRMDRIRDLYEPGLKGLSGWLLLTTDYNPPST